MTTIAYRAGILAADSWATYSSEAGGSRRHICTKLYRKTVGEGKKAHDVIIGTAGETSPALAFLDWFGSGRPIPEVLLQLGGDFSCLVLTPEGLFEADVYCRLDRVQEEFFAIGSGAKAALAAMHCGKSAIEAVRIAARNQAVGQDYDVLLAGRWHQYIHLARMIVNGSLKGYDEYAAAGNFGFEPPTQALWITHPRHGITFRMPVYCDPPTRKAAEQWVSVPR